VEKEKKGTDIGPLMTKDRLKKYDRHVRRGKKWRFIGKRVLKKLSEAGWLGHQVRRSGNLCLSPTGVEMRCLNGYGKTRL